MASNLQYSVAVRTAEVGSIEGTVGTSAKLQIRTGTQPANCAAAASGTLIAELSLPSDWMAAAASGAVAKTGTWSGTASNAGTAAHFRIYDSAGTTCHMQGTAGESGDTPDLVLDNKVITSGQTITISTFTITAGNA